MKASKPWWKKGLPQWGASRRLRHKWPLIELRERVPRAVGADHQPPPRPFPVLAQGLDGVRRHQSIEIDLLGRGQPVEGQLGQIGPDIDGVVFGVRADRQPGRRKRQDLENNAVYV